MSGNVGFVGVGSMGGAMASRTLADGFGVTVFDVDPESVTRLADLGAKVAESPRALANSCDMISVVVRNDEQMRDVVCGDDGVLASGRAGLDIGIHSTIHLSTFYEVAERARLAGCTVLDAAVSGYTTSAEEGTLAVMVGGDEAAVERCRPVLET